MSPRSIRRAAEHKARKLAAKEQRLHEASIANAEPEASATLIPDLHAPALPSTEPRASASASASASEPRATPASNARLAANRANASHSTGPRTPEGKSKISLNAVKTGLTGRTVLLPSDDAAAYQSHIEQYRNEFRPAGLRETELVQSLADTSWRRQRIPGLEMAIYALGRVELGGNFDDHDESVRSNMIELETFFKYEKQLRNLQLQEARLARRYEIELAELRELQKERASREEQSAQAAAATSRKPLTSTASDLGFEFSTGSSAHSNQPMPKKFDRDFVTVL